MWTVQAHCFKSYLLIRHSERSEESLATALTSELLGFLAPKTMLGMTVGSLLK